jgi:hypothetical protein
MERTAVDFSERVLTVEQAGALLGLSRASAYRAAHRWLDTNGTAGLPVLVVSERRLVVPIAALERLLTTALSARADDQPSMASAMASAAPLR